MKETITEKEFEEMYCKSSGITIEEYKEHFVTVSCDCNYVECKGWGAMTKGRADLDQLR